MSFPWIFERAFLKQFPDLQKNFCFSKYLDTQEIKVNKNKTDQHVWKNKGTCIKTTVWSNTSEVWVVYACGFVTRIKTTWKVC